MNIIPTPYSMTLKDGLTEIKEPVSIFCDRLLLNAQNRLETILVNSKIKYILCSEADLSQICIQQNETLAEGEYKLDCEENRVFLSANSRKGALYAVETLRQLADLDFVMGETISFQKVLISDKPFFSYRGLHFDVARHFYEKEDIFTILDQMARMKMNYFHFHLTDDQGFRIPLTKHPKISEIAKTRYGTEIKRIGHVVDNKEYSHIYTREDLDAIVAYATSLGIDIIPELDLPGHMVAVISAYNELSCRGKPIDVRKEWGVSEDLLCAGNPKVYEVVCDILDEICEIFPSRYVHIGGDEAPKTRWKECSKCQALMKEKALETEDDLQGYVFNYFCDYLRKKNKTVIGWNDCLNDTVNEDVIVEHWTTNPTKRDYKNTIKHVNNGRKAIISGVNYYFDHPYAKVSLQDIYNYNVLLEELDESAHKNILGCECCVWTEWMPVKEKMHFNLFPRLAVFAECAWVHKKIDYKTFIVKLQNYYKVYEKCGIYYARGMEYKNPHTVLQQIIDKLTQRLKKFYCEVNKQLKKDGKKLLP